VSCPDERELQRGAGRATIGRHARRRRRVAVSRVVLWLGALVCVPFGIWIMGDPTGLAAMTERPLPTPTAMTESRAVDGGVVLGLGVLFALAALDPTKTRAGLLAMALTFGGPFVGRVVGIVADGGTTATYRVAALELALALLAATALVRDPRPLGGRHP
jgi:hypothetical protein